MAIDLTEIAGLPSLGSEETTHMNIFKYIGLGISVADVVAAFFTLIKTAETEKKKLTGTEIVLTVQPVVLELQMGWGVVLPSPLVTAISTVTAESINQYVLHLA